MDGDIAPVREIVELAERHQCSQLYQRSSHGWPVRPAGGGIAEREGPLDRIDVIEANRCVDLATVRAATTGQNSKLIELTSDQWQFLRGIYAMNPLTPPGLPYGDKAALVKIDGSSGGMVFFIDGDKACTPMAVR